jgi:hypothetical protein
LRDQREAGSNIHREHCLTPSATYSTNASVIVPGDSKNRRLKNIPYSARRDDPSPARSIESIHREIL